MDPHPTPMHNIEALLVQSTDSIWWVTFHATNTIPLSRNIFAKGEGEQMPRLCIWISQVLCDTNATPFLEISYQKLY